MHLCTLLTRHVGCLLARWINTVATAVGRVPQRCWVQMGSCWVLLYPAGGVKATNCSWAREHPGNELARVVAVDSLVCSNRRWIPAPVAATTVKRQGPAAGHGGARPAPDSCLTLPLRSLYDYPLVPTPCPPG